MEGRPALAGTRVTKMLARGLIRHCPVCGQGRLFRRWFTMTSTCPRCGLRFERIEGHWVGAVGINTIVTFVLLFLVVVIGLALSYPDFDDVVSVFVAAALTAVLFPIAFFPISRTLWTAIDIAMRPLHEDEAPGR